MRGKLLIRGMPVALAVSLAGPTGVPAASAQVGELPVCRQPVAQASQGPATRTVCSAAELDDVLRAEPPFRGRIVIPRGLQLEMKNRAGKPLREIPLRSGVELVGQRGALGSRPLLFTRDKTKRSLFEITGNNVRVEGLHLRGPKPPDDRKKEDYVHAIRVIENAEERLGRHVVIADNELEHWGGAAVYLVGRHGNVLLDDWDPDKEGWKHLGAKSGPDLVRVERNYIHHNAMNGGGYGVDVAGGAYVTIEGNVFDFNRHAVAGTGRAYSGYVARHNYVLQGGYKDDGDYQQHFDVHGSGDGGYGGYAGEYFRIVFNTIRGEQHYNCFAGFCAKSRPAFMLRGKPAQGAYFGGNVVVHEDLDEAVSLKWEKGDTGFGEDHDKFNFHASGGDFDGNYSAELATGDFDRDGRSDVFVANGTGWFFSRAGVRPWELLQTSTRRTRDLAFADIDNDGVTDVFHRDRSGRLLYFKSGRAAAVTPLASPPVPVPITDLRFGDFDGDRLTDVFYTLNGKWQVWRGSTCTWTPAQTSNKPITELLFGEFDTVRGTDVAGVNSSGWAFSSAATQGWAPLNGRLTDSFKDAVAADFDGNGRTDIAVGTTKKWRFSRDGRSALVTLRDGDPAHANLKQLPIGHFDGGAQDIVISFDFRVVGLSVGFGERFLGFRFPASAFGTRSTQNMR